jgi:hypothetical protein
MGQHCVKVGYVPSVDTGASTSSTVDTIHTSSGTAPPPSSTTPPSISSSGPIAVDVWLARESSVRRTEQNKHIEKLLTRLSHNELQLLLVRLL